MASPNPDLVAASNALVRETELEAVILFGSQARGDASDASDIDLVLAGPGDQTKNGRLIAKACELVPHADVAWLDTNARDHLDQGLTVWAEVARDGIVLAGDSTILEQLRTEGTNRVNRPAWRALVMSAISDTCIALNSLRNREDVPEINATPTRASAEAAEALTRLTIGSFGMKPGPNHDTNRDRIRWYNHVTEHRVLDEPERDRLNELLESINGGTRTIRNAIYHLKSEPRRKWLARTMNVAEGLIDYLDNIGHTGHAPRWFKAIGERPELATVQHDAIEFLIALDEKLDDLETNAKRRALDKLQDPVQKLRKRIGETLEPIRNASAHARA